MSGTPLEKSCLTKGASIPASHVRCVCISDTHNKHDEIVVPEGDILFCVGDISMSGSEAEIRSFNEFLGSLPHKLKIVIAGNHDLCLADSKSAVDASSLLSNCTYLQDSGISAYGIKIYGSPWVPLYGSWAFSKVRGKPLLEMWRKIPSETDILLTHSPPSGIGDLTVHGDHAGCVDLLNEIQKRIKPKFHIFGHIHEGYSITSDGHTTFINCSVCDVYYNVVNEPVVFDIPKSNDSM